MGSPQGPDEAGTTVRVGLVGAGFIGTVHAFSLQLLTDADLVDAELTAVYDVDRSRAERVARGHGGQVVDSLDRLVEHVDAVVCAPWTAAHEPVVAAAAEAGRAVLCEKPLGRDLAEAERVAALLEHVPHQVGLVLRFSPMLARVEAELRSGVHGRAMAFVLRDDQYFPDHGLYGSDWRADPHRAGSGTLLEHSIHDVDLLTRLGGEATAVTGSTAALTGRAVEDVAAVLLELEGGVVAQLTSVWHEIDDRTSSRSLEVICERGLLATDADVVGVLRIHRPEGVSDVQVSAPSWCAQLGLAPEHVGPLSAYVAQMRAFIEGPAAGDRTSSASGRTALAAHRIVDAAYTSNGTGSRIELVEPR